MIKHLTLVRYRCKLFFDGDLPIWWSRHFPSFQLSQLSISFLQFAYVGKYVFLRQYNQSFNVLKNVTFLTHPGLEFYTSKSVVCYLAINCFRNGFPFSSTFPDSINARHPWWSRVYWPLDVHRFQRRCSILRRGNERKLHWVHKYMWTVCRVSPVRDIQRRFRPLMSRGAGGLSANNCCCEYKSYFCFSWIGTLRRSVGGAANLIR